MKIFKTIVNIIVETLLLAVSTWLYSIHVSASATSVGTAISVIFILPLLLTCLGGGLAYALTLVIIGIVKKSPALIIIHAILTVLYILTIISTFIVM